jgi:APA family basic amino acid/polyamine antiporter
MIVNAAVQFALPAAAVAASSSPMADAVRNSVMGGAAAIVVSVAMIISLTTSLNGVALSGSRMTFALSRDGNFFSSLSKVHPRFHTPHVAITVQAILSLGFLFLGGNFRQLFTLALFAEWLSYTAAAIALFVFRSGPKAVPDAVPLWKFPLAPAVFIVASAALLYYTFSSNLRYSGLGSLVILAGIPVYYAFTLRR